MVPHVLHPFQYMGLNPASAINSCPKYHLYLENLTTPYYFGKTLVPMALTSVHMPPLHPNMTTMSTTSLPQFVLVAEHVALIVLNDKLIVSLISFISFTVLTSAIKIGLNIDKNCLVCRKVNTI